MDTNYVAIFSSLFVFVFFGSVAGAKKNPRSEIIANLEILPSTVKNSATYQDWLADRSKMKNGILR